MPIEILVLFFGGVRRLPDGTEQPTRFVSARIELYKKRAGDWVTVGNVSNFRAQGHQ